MNSPGRALATWRLLYGLIGLLLLGGSTLFIMLAYNPDDAYSELVLVLAAPFFVVGFFLALPFIFRQSLGRTGMAIARALSWLFLLSGAAGFFWFISDAGGDQVTMMWAAAYFGLPGLLLMDCYRRWGNGE